MPNNVIPFPGTAPSASAAPQTPSAPSVLDQDPFWVAKRVWMIRYRQEYNQDQKQRIIYNFIWSYENSKTRTGLAWLRTRDTGRVYLYEGRRTRLYTVDQNNTEFTGYLWDTYGLNSTEDLTRYLITALKNGATAKGLVRDIRRFTYWDRGNQTLFISGYDGTCYQITGHADPTVGVTVVANGTGSAVFLDDDKGWTPSDPLLGNNRALFTHLIDDLQYAPTTVGGMSPEIQKTCLGIWIFALAFPDLMPTKPLLLVEGEKGSGKCLGRGTPVLMYDGSVRSVESVRDGDLVMGADSRPRRVAGVTRGHGPLYRITPTKGDSWICNEEHILTVVLSGRFNKRGEYIDRGAVIDVPLKECAPHTDGTRVKGRSYAMLLRTGVEFSSKPVPVEPYLVGLWLGDGHVHKPAITNVDDEILDYCQKIAPQYDVETRIEIDARNGVRTVVFTTGNGGQHGRNFLTNYFPTLFVDGEKRIPREYLINDVNKRRELLAGIIDTDGHYSSEYEIITKHRGLRDDILFLARSIGLAAYSTEKKSTIKSRGFEGHYHRIIISGHLDKIPCKLTRKQAKSRRQPKDVLRTGFVIEPLGTGDYYGFTLDGDGRFLLGDFTITHNTAALQRIALALHGKYMPLQVSKKEDPDFGVKILRSPIPILDDVNEPVDWLRDALCTYATGGGWTRRALFTNDEEHTIKPESFLTITTNNPTTFRQTQVADRCLIIRLERREDRDGYLGADALFGRIRDNRDEIFGDWLTWLNEIVGELRTNPRPAPTRSRMADFAHLAHVIGRVLARPGGPPGNWSPEAIEEMLDAMQHERNALVIEGDPLIDLLDKWLDTASNQGREVRAAELHRELQILARIAGTTPFFRSPKALASRLREASTALGQHFEITRRTQGGTLLYTFRRA